MSKRKQTVELLAPAGSYESMTAAIYAGADAVYIGGSKFGARAYAKNPDQDMLIRAIHFAHFHDRQIYLTVNTLFKEKELEELYDYLYPYYREGLDAVIVQDLGAFHYIRRNFPDLPVHASTQMTITGTGGARFLKESGAARIVTARELSLEEIESIHQNVDIEIETFVHGALCYCYSGQCLYSSLIGGRSGNRGRCAQPCRLPYTVLNDNKEMNKKEEQYLLSPKDLCGLDLLPQLIEAGVSSMKIEGRMKSPRYTAGVVSIYRKYLDLYLEKGGKGYRVEPKDKKMLLELFDRGGFTDGYFQKHNGKDMIALKEKPGFREGNQELFDSIDREYIQKTVKEKIKGKVKISQDLPATIELEWRDCHVSAEGDIPQSAQKQPMTPEKIKKQIDKTGSTPFEFSSLEIQLEDGLFLPIQSMNELRRKALTELEDVWQAKYRRQEPKRRERQSERPQNLQKETPLHVLVENLDLLEIMLLHPQISAIEISFASISPSIWKDTVIKCHECGKDCIMVLPHILRIDGERYLKEQLQLLHEAQFDGFLVKSLEELNFLKENGVKGKVILDHNVYTFNRESVEFFKEEGVTGFTAPVELNSKELGMRECGDSMLLLYGRLPMMVSAQCVFKTAGECGRKHGNYTLKDRKGVQFPVLSDCRFCQSTIYNSSPLSLLDQVKEVKRLNPEGYRLHFTLESKNEASNILQAFINNYYLNKNDLFPGKDFTRGHFKRGVE